MCRDGITSSSAVGVVGDDARASDIGFPSEHLLRAGIGGVYCRMRWTS